MARLKTTTTAVAVLGLALAAGLGWWWMQRAASPQGVAGQASGAAQPSPTRATAQGAPGTPAGQGRPGGGTQAAAVEVARVQSLDLADEVQAVGSLKSRQGVMLRPEASGRVARIGFVDGQRVRRGQVLLQLDDALQQAQLQQALAQAGIARINLQRSRELLAQNFISQSAVDQNEAALQVADSQVALAQAQVARMRLVAPFDGTVGIRSVELGDYVKDGAEVVGLEDLSSLFVEFTLPERHLPRVRPGQPVEVRLDAVPDTLYAARVDALDAQVDTNGRALRVRAALQDLTAAARAPLRPGMFARARVVFESRSGATVVPEEALVPLGGRQLLFKVVTGEDGKPVAKRLDARLGLRLPGRVEIIEGLSVDDLVVTAGHARLLRGDAVPVRVIELPQPGTAGSASGPAKPASATPKP